MGGWAYLGELPSDGGKEARQLVAEEREPGVDPVMDGNGVALRIPFLDGLRGGEWVGGWVGG